MKENLKMVYVKEMEFFMEIIMKYIKENSKMVKFMDSEVFMKLINIIESIYIMKEILLKMRFMVKVLNFMQMAQKKQKELLNQLIHMKENIIIQKEKKYIMVKL